MSQSSPRSSLPLVLAKAPATKYFFALLVFTLLSTMHRDAYYRMGIRPASERTVLGDTFMRGFSPRLIARVRADSPSLIDSAGRHFPFRFDTLRYACPLSLSRQLRLAVGTRRRAVPHCAHRRAVDDSCVCARAAVTLALARR